MAKVAAFMVLVVAVAVLVPLAYKVVEWLFSSPADKRREAEYFEALRRAQEKETEGTNDKQG